MKREPSDLKKRTGAELRALAEQRRQASPDQEAQSREASFLANLSRAQNDFEWIVEHQAWTLLGHDSLAEWWAAKVAPVMSALSMRLTPEMATKVIEKVKAAEAHLPASQRHSARDLAALVGTSDWTARGRQDRDKRRDADHPDLENPVVDPVSLVPAAEKAVNDFINNQTSPGTAIPADGAEGAADSSGLAVPSDSPKTDPETNASSDSDVSGSAAGDGASADRPAPAATQDRPVDAPGAAEDGRPSGGDSSAADGAPTPPATQTGPEVPTPVEPSGLVDGREQRGPTGVSSPVAPDPEKVRRNEALAKWALDTPEGRALAKRALVHDWIAAGWDFLDEVGPDVFAEIADAGMHEDMDRLLAAIAGWAEAKKANSGIRLVKGA